MVVGAGSSRDDGNCTREKYPDDIEAICFLLQGVYEEEQKAMDVVEPGLEGN